MIRVAYVSSNVCVGVFFFFCGRQLQEELVVRRKARELAALDKKHEQLTGSGSRQKMEVCVCVCMCVCVNILRVVRKHDKQIGSGSRQEIEVWKADGPVCFSCLKSRGPISFPRFPGKKSRQEIEGPSAFHGVGFPAGNGGVCVCVCVYGLGGACVCVGVRTRSAWLNHEMHIGSGSRQEMEVCVCVCVCVYMWLCMCVCVCVWIAYTKWENAKSRLGRVPGRNTLRALSVSLTCHCENDTHSDHLVCHRHHCAGSEPDPVCTLSDLWVCMHVCVCVCVHVCLTVCLCVCVLTLLPLSGIVWKDFFFLVQIAVFSFLFFFLSLCLSLSHTHTLTHTHSTFNLHSVVFFLSFSFFFSFSLSFSLSLFRIYTHTIPSMRSFYLSLLIYKNRLYEKRHMKKRLFKKRPIKWHNPFNLHSVVDNTASF